ncbi:MAG: DUF5906 domain-containing protein [Bacteroidetes bacterium]|nr:DUF5906 domain-containing protein [Bacteroidota bacterium]
MKGKTISISINKNLTEKIRKQKGKEYINSISRDGWEPLTVDPFNLTGDFFSSCAQYFAELFDYSKGKDHLNTDFSSISAIVLDYDAKDGSITSKEADELIKNMNFKAYLVGGSSYDPLVKDSFRIIFPLEKQIGGMELSEIINLIAKSKTPFAKGLDPTAGTMRFWQPASSALYSTNEATELLSIERIEKYFNIPVVRKLDEIDYSKAKRQETKLLDGIVDITLEASSGEFKLGELSLKEGQKKQCFCPDCGNNPGRSNKGKNNAFISVNSKGAYYLYCSSESKTIWFEPNVELATEPYYVLGKAVYEVSVEDHKIWVTEVRDKIFFIRAKVANNKDLEDKFFAHIVNNKFISTSFKVEYLHSAEWEKEEFEREGNTLRLKIPAIPVQTQDNQFIENVLDEWFGNYKDFIKEWWASYCYTNFVKLPTLLLTGKRSTGKNTFVEMVMKSFPNSVATPIDLDARFNPYVERKLIFLDEHLESGVKQYKLLKQLSGSDFLQMEKKFADPVQVRNNLNVIIASNDSTPIWLKRNEVPADEIRNQFFAWEFPTLPSNKMDAQLKEKLEERIGHYIRTELLEVFNSIKGNMKNFRYAIPVPITDPLKEMYNRSVSPNEEAADEFIEEWENSLIGFKKEVRPSEIKKWCKDNSVNSTWLIKELKERKWMSSELQQKRDHGKQYRSYEILDPVNNKLNNQGGKPNDE